MREIDHRWQKNIFKRENKMHVSYIYRWQKNFVKKNYVIKVTIVQKLKLFNFLFNFKMYNLLLIAVILQSN